MKGRREQRLPNLTLLQFDILGSKVLHPILLEAGLSEVTL